MSTYVLILYLSAATSGAPAVIDGFKTLQQCEEANLASKEQLPRYDWGKCIKVNR